MDCCRDSPPFAYNFLLHPSLLRVNKYKSLVALEELITYLSATGPVLAEGLYRWREMFRSRLKVEKLVFEKLGGEGE
jgi:hypothetical protein